MANDGDGDGAEEQTNTHILHTQWFKCDDGADENENQTKYDLSLVDWESRASILMRQTKKERNDKTARICCNHING